MADEAKKKKKLTLDIVWREAKELMWRHRYKLALGFGLMLIGRLAGLVAPGSSKFLIDNVIGEGQYDLLPWLALAVGLATVVQAITGFANSQVVSITAQRAIMEMRQKVQAQVTRLPVSFFSDTQTGNLISRIMTDAEGIRNLVGTGIIQLIGGFITAILALGVLFWLNWQLTLFTLVVLALFGWAMTFTFKKLRPIFRERGKINAEVTGRLNETLGGIRVVKAYGTEEREQSVFASGVLRLFENIKSSITGVSAISSFSTVIIGAISVIMILGGGEAISEGTMTLGDFVMYLFFIGLLAAPVIQIASISTQISEAFAGLDRIREIMTMLTEDAEDETREPLGEVSGEIRFEEVSFAYEEEVPVLKNISFTAPAGTTTALVGSSGSGKSTLVSLVMAFNRPDAGRVLLDGRDLDTIKLREYRNELGVVLQENFLFDGTIAENIRFANPEATDAEIAEAARLANAHDFISAFPDGYESVVGERGIKLSGGQRQRIAIARALLADPRLLILDEATSSLDSESEALIQEGLQSLRTGRTAFVIAHRLSTILSADQILVIEDGEIVERGTHDELMTLGGRYRDLYERQHRWERNRFVNPGETVASYQ